MLTVLVGTICLSAIFPTGCRIDCPSSSGVCGCRSGGCQCATGSGCGDDGMCYPCSYWDCRSFPLNSGCKCDAGTLCTTAGTCSILENHKLTGDHPNCVGFSCNNLGFADFIDGRCTCKCTSGYTGASCNQCNDGKSGWPHCTSVGIDCPADYCNHHGIPYYSSVSRLCLCRCSSGFSGERCTSCSSGVGLYPECSSNITISSASTASAGEDYLIPTVVGVSVLVLVLVVGLCVVWSFTRKDKSKKNSSDKENPESVPPPQPDPYVVNGHHHQNPIDNSFPGK